MLWLKIDEKFAKELVELCKRHDARLAKKLEAELKVLNEPEEDWQNRNVARDLARSQVDSDQVEVDEDSAIANCEDGLCVQAWLYVYKSDIESATVKEVQED